MRVEERVAGQVALLSLSGELIAGEAGAQLITRVRRLLEYDCRSLVLDVVSLRLVDSAGLGTLVEVCVAARNRGATMTLFGVSPSLRDLLVVTRLASFFEDDDDLGADDGVLQPLPRRPTVN